MPGIMSMMPKRYQEGGPVTAEDLKQQLAGPVDATKIRQAYEALLGRTPSAAALEYWTGQEYDPNIDYQDRPTELGRMEDVITAITQGPEYTALNPISPPTEGFRVEPSTLTRDVQAEFRRLYGRDPSMEEFEFYTGLDYDPLIAASEDPGSFANITEDLTKEAVTTKLMQDPVVQARMAAGLVGDGTETAQPGTDGEYVPFEYTPFPQAQGGIYGPGQGMPMIFQPAGQQQGSMATGLREAMAAGSQGDTGTMGAGPRTLVSPGITTYAYPQPFGNIDIFNRPGAQGPTPFNPNEMYYQGGVDTTNTTTQQNMDGSMAAGLENLSPAQRALLGNIFG